jgi:hypothetical protein
VTTNSVNAIRLRGVQNLSALPIVQDARDTRRVRDERPGRAFGDETERVNGPFHPLAASLTVRVSGDLEGGRSWRNEGFNDGSDKVELLRRQ